MVTSSWEPWAENVSERSFLWSELFMQNTHTTLNSTFSIHPVPEKTKLRSLNRPSAAALTPWPSSLPGQPPAPPTKQVIVFCSLFCHSFPSSCSGRGHRTDLVSGSWLIDLRSINEHQYTHTHPDWFLGFVSTSYKYNPDSLPNLGYNKYTSHLNLSPNCNLNLILILTPNLTLNFKNNLSLDNVPTKTEKL